MLADSQNEKLEFLQPIETVTVDTIADFVGTHVFVDLLTAVLEEDTEGVMQAYARGAPVGQEKPANPDAFNGLFKTNDVSDEL